MTRTAHFIDGNQYPGLPAGATVEQFRFLKLDGNGDVIHAVATDDAIVVGISERSGDTGDGISFRLCSAAGTWRITAGGVIAAGAAVAVGADGKAVAGAGGFVAMNAAAADGDIIEITRGGG